MRRLALAVGAFVAILGGTSAGIAGAQPGPSQRALTRALTRGMNQIGGTSSGLVVDLSTHATLFQWAPDAGRIPASMQKLYTTSTALLRFGPSATLDTTVRGVGSMDATGTWHGRLYLVGGGDPTFGSAGFDHIYYGTGATMQRLAANLRRATGLRSLRGAIIGDESHLDSLRGTPATGYRANIPDVEGELSGLAYDRGFADLERRRDQIDPRFHPRRLVPHRLSVAADEVDVAARHDHPRGVGEPLRQPEVGLADGGGAALE